MAAARSSPPFDELTFYPSERWIRGIAAAGGAIVDSRRALLVWRPRRMPPAYAFPRDDVDVERLTGGNGRGPEALVEYDDPELAGYVSVAWDGADHWYEEDEEIFVHPRDPFVRVDAIASTRDVRVEVDGRVLGESSRPVLVFETGLPTRYYLPREDVDASLLHTSDRHTDCPYKGTASYYDVEADRRHRDVVWYYPEPLAAVAAIRDRLAVFGERVELFVDGELQRHPAARRRA